MKAKGGYDLLGEGKEGYDLGEWNDTIFSVRATMRSLGEFEDTICWVMAEARYDIFGQGKEGYDILGECREVAVTLLLRAEGSPQGLF